MSAELQTKKNISVMHEEGMEDIAVYAQEAIHEVLDAMPSLKLRFAVKNFGFWRGECFCSDHYGFLPYDSVDWFIDQAEKKSDAQGRFSRRQISANQLVADLSEDPSRAVNDEWVVFLTKQDLYAQNADGSFSDFVHGTYRDNAACVISTKRFYDQDSRYFDKECFKTAVQHYVGRMFGMNDEQQEKNVDPKLRRDCVIQVPEKNDFKDLTHVRLKRKQVGLSSICPHCVEQMVQRVKSWDMRTEHSDIFGRSPLMIQQIQADRSK